MKLLTKALREKLIKNYNENVAKSAESGETIDFKPVVKFFNPCGAATWYLTELDPNTNDMFGLCDLGMGYPELGYVNLDELASLKVGFGLGIERDILWKADKTLSEFVNA